MTFDQELTALLYGLGPVGATLMLVLLIAISIISTYVAGRIFNSHTNQLIGHLIATQLAAMPEDERKLIKYRRGLSGQLFGIAVFVVIVIAVLATVLLITSKA